MPTIEELQTELEKIKERNQRVKLKRPSLL